MSPYIDNDYYYFFKLCVLGKSSVGKSSLVFRFAGDEFHESCLPTMGVDFKIRKIQLNNKSIKLQLWDSAG